jgi:hypothetical protein
MSGPDRTGLGSELVNGRIGSRPGLVSGVMSGHTSGLVSDSELEIRVYTVFSLHGCGPSCASSTVATRCVTGGVFISRSSGLSPIRS